MKKIAFLAFLLLTTTLVFAQEGNRERGRRQFSPEEFAKRNTEWMKQELKLTEAQIAPVDSVNLLYAKAQAVLFQSAGEDREKIREAMTELGVKKEEALSVILTKEQLDLYKKRMKERSNRGFNRNN